MITATAKRTFLIGQEHLEGGKRKDILAHRGQQLKLNERDAIKFWGGLKFSDSDEKKLLSIARTQKVNRII